MSLFQDNLKFKLSASLFALICLGFALLILFPGQTLKSRANDAVTKIADQVSALESGSPSFQSDRSQINQALNSLPQTLVNETRMTSFLTAVVCLIGVLAGAGLLVHFIFFKPVKALTLGLEKAIQGEEKDLTIRLPQERKDEIGQLSEKFNAFISTLDGIVRDIGSKTETIAAASSEVSGISDLMNDESVDLNTRSNSVSAAAEEMNVSMQNMAAASDQASANIAMVAEAAGQMQGQMAGVAGNCDNAGQISNAARTEAQTAAQKVGQLGDAANEITQVTQMITEIAEQTNLLALNATIEAARAGSAGKGFAVVADEIKNLAAQTAKATQHIQEKIGDIQESTREAVDEVSHIADVIANVDEIVHDISRSVEEQSGTAAEVAANIEQASSGISQVNDNLSQSSVVASEIASDIAQVDTVAAGMSERSRGLNSGARDLDSLSLSLQKMISVFKVTRSSRDMPGATASKSAANSVPVAELMPWGPKLATGINEIDTQHKELVRLINLLHAAMRQQKGAQEVGQVLDDLANYTVFHFGFEEKLFDRYKYPDTENHKKFHTELVGKVVDFQKDFNAGKASVTMELMDFLKNWLRGHIMGTDMAYTPFLKEHMAGDKEFQKVA